MANDEVCRTDEVQMTNVMVASRTREAASEGSYLASARPANLLACDNSRV